MAKLSVRNRNKGQLDKLGKPKDASWEYRFQTAAVDGKRKWICKGGFRTKKEAEVAGVKAMNEYSNAGTKFEPSEISVSDYLDYWLKNYCTFNVSDNTLAAYRNIIKNHLKPRIGHYQLKSITTIVLQEMVNDIYVSRGFTKSFMKNILKVTKGSFHYAKVTAKLIQIDPAADVELPNMSSDSDPEEIIILSKNDINRILERFEKSPATYYAILAAYYTGLRVAEVYGLTWDCVDFENKTITVNKNVKCIEKEGKETDGKRLRPVRAKAATRWYFGSCKTPTSYRTIDIGDTLLEALRCYKQWQEDNEKLYDDLYMKHYLKAEITETHRQVQRIISMQDLDVEIPMERTYPVFIKENGEFGGSATVKYASKVINYELGIKFNFHALRHTHATMLIEAGVPVKTVSERLGHGNVRTTLDTYVHVTRQMKNDAVNIFEKTADLNSVSNLVSFETAKRTAAEKAN